MAGRELSVRIAYGTSYLAGIIGAAVLLGCRARDRSIVILQSFDPRVENGVAFDESIVNLADSKKLVLPTQRDQA
jgi:hypothetical protein